MLDAARQHAEREHKGDEEAAKRISLASAEMISDCCEKLLLTFTYYYLSR
jgi:hypothetical protein